MRGLAEFQKAFMGPYVDGHMELKGRFYVQFNPAELSIEEAMGVSDVSQADGRVKSRQMKKGNSVGQQYPPKGSSHRKYKGLTTLSVNLFYNTLNDLYQTSYDDVREEIRKLYPYTNTTEIIENTDAQKGQKTSVTKKNKAQLIYFFWGSIAVAGMLRHMSVTYTMFAPDGKPVRAQVSISIEGFYVGEEIASDRKAEGAGASGKSAGTGKASCQAYRDRDYQGSINPRLCQ